MDAMFSTGWTARTPARVARRRRSRPLATERLESRVLMAADVSAALAANRFVWNGETVTARADAWIVGTNTAAGSMGIRTGWQTSSLGEGFVSLIAPGASPTDILGWSRTTAGIRSIEPDRVVTASALPSAACGGSIIRPRQAGLPTPTSMPRPRGMSPPDRGPWSSP